MRSQIDSIIDVGRPVTAAQILNSGTHIRLVGNFQHLEAGLLLHLHTANGIALRFRQRRVILVRLIAHTI